MKRRKIVMYILLLIGTKGYAKLNSLPVGGINLVHT